MRTNFRRSRRMMALAAVAALTTSLLAGCAKDAKDGSSDDADGGNGKGKITLTVGTYGVFGYKQAGLYDEYMKLHPDINIKENVTTAPTSTGRRCSPASRPAPAPMTFRPSRSATSPRPCRPRPTSSST